VTPTTQNVKTVALHVLITFLAAFSSVMTATQLAGQPSTARSLVISGVTAGVAAVGHYLSGVIALAPKDHSAP
jgi:hypothetical protein